MIELDPDSQIRFVNNRSGKPKSKNIRIRIIGNAKKRYFFKIKKWFVLLCMSWLFSCSIQKCHFFLFIWYSFDFNSFYVNVSIILSDLFDISIREAEIKRIRIQNTEKNYDFPLGLGVYIFDLIELLVGWGTNIIIHKEKNENLEGK